MVGFSVNAGTTLESRRFRGRALQTIAPASQVWAGWLAATAGLPTVADECCCSCEKFRVLPIDGCEQLQQFTRTAYPRARAASVGLAPFKTFASDLVGAAEHVLRARAACGKPKPRRLSLRFRR